MLDLPISPFLVPAQLSCGASTPVSSSTSSSFATASPFNSFPGAMQDASAQDYGAVFCSPPRQSFQLLLRGGEDPVLKDEFELLLPPRRTSSRVSSNSSSSASQTGLPPRSASTAVASVKQQRATRGVKARGAATGPLQPKKRPKRKASYLARKEEKEALLKHLEELQSQLNTLKYQAVVHGGYRAQTQSRKRLTKNILTEAVQNHQLAVAGLQAMLSNYSVRIYIHTTLDLSSSGCQYPINRMTGTLLS